MKRFLGAVLVGMVLVAATSGVGWAKADIYTTRGNFPFHLLVISPCLDESIAFCGQAHFIVHITAYNNDDMHVIGEVTYANVQGVGTMSGTVYRFTAALHVVENYTGGASNETNTDNTQIVSRGSGDNLILRTSYHITRNADGTVTIELSHIEGVCRG